MLYDQQAAELATMMLKDIAVMIVAFIGMLLMFTATQRKSIFFYTSAFWAALLLWALTHP